MFLVVGLGDSRVARRLVENVVEPLENQFVSLSHSLEEQLLSSIDELHLGQELMGNDVAREMTEVLSAMHGFEGRGKGQAFRLDVRRGGSARAVERRVEGVRRALANVLLTLLGQVPRVGPFQGHVDRHA